MNFGIEGESYEMKDGYPTYTDKIMHNPDGLNVSEAMSKYILGNNSGPFVQDERYIEQYYTLPQQKEALNVWVSSDAPKNSIPIVAFTSEESNHISTIMNDVETSADEMIFKFIMGIEPMEKYDSFVELLKDFGIDEAIELYQGAVDRYNRR